MKPEYLAETLKALEEHANTTEIGQRQESNPYPEQLMVLLFLGRAFP